MQHVWKRNEKLQFPTNSSKFTSFLLHPGILTVSSCLSSSLPLPLPLLPSLMLSSFSFFLPSCRLCAIRSFRAECQHWTVCHCLKWSFKLLVASINCVLARYSCNFYIIFFHFIDVVTFLWWHYSPAVFHCAALSICVLMFSRVVLCLLFVSFLVFSLRIITVLITTVMIIRFGINGSTYNNSMAHLIHYHQMCNL